MGCPFTAWSWAQPLAYLSIGWWDTGVSHSFLGQGLIFIPCYWLGFYVGPRVFPYLTWLADDSHLFRRLLIALGIILVYINSYNFGLQAMDSYDDRCGRF